MNKVSHLNIVSLFSNVGIAESLLNDNNISVKVANEIDPKRCEYYKAMYLHTNVICGDIQHEEVFDSVFNEAIKNNCNLLLATPPCQGMSVAGKMKKEDHRNSLIKYVVQFIKKTNINYAIIENVPTMPNFLYNRRQ